MFDTTYRTITLHASGEYKSKGSKFIGEAFPVTTETECKSLIAEFKKVHPKANHHCYAYRLGYNKELFRWNDDREPSNTAGKPIYGVIQSNDLTNVLIVVVRYFGGTLLGVPGLIQAYRAAAADAIAHAEIVVRDIEETYELSFDYMLMNEVMSIIKSFPIRYHVHSNTDHAGLTVIVKKTHADLFLQTLQQHHLLSGKVVISVNS
jgi:uncharacterized YigZ family protein